MEGGTRAKVRMTQSGPGAVKYGRWKCGSEENSTGSPVEKREIFTPRLTPTPVAQGRTGAKLMRWSWEGETRFVWRAGKKAFFLSPKPAFVSQREKFGSQPRQSRLNEEQRGRALCSAEAQGRAAC